MKTNYPKSKSRKIRVRTVKSNRQPPILNTDNIINTRRQEKGFGGTFFLKMTDRKTIEQNSWDRLEKKLTKRLQDD